MSGQQEILREYLVSLGFKIDTRGQKKVSDTLTDMDKQATLLAKGVVGVGAAAITMVTQFSRAMERMAYDSRYIGTTTDRLQAFEFGATRIGMAAGQATNLLRNFSTALRSQPGLEGMLNSLGVKVAGRPKEEVFKDFIKSLKGFPEYIQQQYAAQFGIDPESLFKLREGAAKQEEMERRRTQMYADAKLDAKELEDNSIRLMDNWSLLKERVGIFGQAVLMAAQGPITDLYGATDQLLVKWTQLVKKIGEAAKTRSMDPTDPDGMWARAGREIGTSLTKEDGPRVTLSADAAGRIGAGKERMPSQAEMDMMPLSQQMYWKWRIWRDRKTGVDFGGAVATDPAAVDAVQQPIAPASDQPSAPPPDEDERQSYLRALEKRYALPPGVLKGLYSVESSNGTNLIGKQTKYGRAMGPFQFIPSTAKEYNVDPMNFESSAEGAARKMRNLLAAYANEDGTYNLKQSLQAWNIGEGEMSKYALGRRTLPKETQEFADKVLSAGGITQNTEIHVHGVTDPAAAAKQVEQSQRDVNADLIRNHSPKVR